jgi:hypothetical protein
MRDVNRLYGFYNELMKIHMEHFPDLRFGQLINNLERWLQINKKIDDIFYVEEEDMLRYLNEFVERIK